MGRTVPGWGSDLTTGNESFSVHAILQIVVVRFLDSIPHDIGATSASVTPIRKNIQTLAVTRVTVASSRPFPEVVAALNHELNASKAGINLLRLLATATSKQELVDGVDNPCTHSLFNSASYRWLSVFLDGEHTPEKTLSFTLGNPLLGQKILRYDTTAALNIPPRIIVQEAEEGGTRIIYDLPSSVVDGKVQPKEMRDALAELDTKLESLVRHVLEVPAKL